MALQNEEKRRLGTAIRMRRMAIGLSKQRFALMVDVNRLTLRRIESGEANPTLDVLLRIASGLDTSLDELFSLAAELPEEDIPIARA